MLSHAPEIHQPAYSSVLLTVLLDLWVTAWLQRSAQEHILILILEFMQANEHSRQRFLLLLILTCSLKSKQIKYFTQNIIKGGAFLFSYFVNAISNSSWVAKEALNVDDLLE